MNSVVLIGRLTKDPAVSYTQGSQMAVTRFTLAIDRPMRAGAEKQTDFISVVVFGKQAENCGKYLAKGRMTAVSGRIQTGSYTNKEGRTVYTTDVVADRVEFLDWGNTQRNSHSGGQDFEASQRGFDNSSSMGMQQEETRDDFREAPPAFESIDEDMPF